ncbi:MAG: hypothetical protein R3C10_03270 [Pirellulales bacterium]
MTEAATIDPPQRRPGPGLRAGVRPGRTHGARSLSDTSNWTNQNVVFTQSLRDMFPLAKTIVKGAAA